jgi:enoyl-CoA hydratase
VEFTNLLVQTLEHGVGLIRINRPQVLNALNQATLLELVAAFDAFANDDAVRCVVLTGSDRAFAAGADISEMSGKGIAEMLTDTRLSSWKRLRDFPKPTIAAVSGFCLGGGLELAMLCDIILASESARFGQPEINLGIIPGAGGTQRLTRAVGKSLAMEMVLNARNLTAPEALEVGLVSRVVPVETHLTQALQLAAQIAARAPLAVRLAKDAVNHAFDGSLDTGLEFERKNFVALFGTEDQKEGMKAFLEKRAAKWTGK